MIIYYWSIAKTDPLVYHWQQRCPVGEQILPENREDGNVPLKGRMECRECPQVAESSLVTSTHKERGASLGISDGSLAARANAAVPRH